jgi:hypothetical protein
VNYVIPFCNYITLPGIKEISFVKVKSVHLYLTFSKYFLKISLYANIMKKGISISLVFLMLAAMFHFSVATHYCNGKVAASTVSLSGKLATCGMECSEKGLPLSGTNFTKHCCNDIVTFCGIDSNYTPSFSFVPEYYQYNFQHFSIPIGSPVYSMAVLKSLYTNVSPPGVLMSTSVDLSDICIFRI